MQVAMRVLLRGKLSKIKEECKNRNHVYDDDVNFSE